MKSKLHWHLAKLNENYMQFNSKQLLRLFLKPKASLHAKKSGSGNVVRGVDGGDTVPEHVDERYWAEAAQRNKIVTSSNSFLRVD